VSATNSALAPLRKRAGGMQGTASATRRCGAGDRTGGSLRRSPHSPLAAKDARTCSRESGPRRWLATDKKAAAGGVRLVQIDHSFTASVRLSATSRCGRPNARTPARHTDRAGPGCHAVRRNRHDNHRHHRSRADRHCHDATTNGVRDSNPKPKEEAMKRTFVGGSVGYVYPTVRSAHAVGGSAGWVQAW
jgi:hypothetical protein